MKPYSYIRADNLSAALQAGSKIAIAPGTTGDASAQYLAGGTTLIDLMKLDVL